MLRLPGVVLKRCAWHRHYFRYPWVFGVASWSGRGLRLADGICPRCTARIRRDLTVAGRAWRTSEPTPWEPPMALPPTIVIVLAAVVIILAARPLDPTPPVVKPLPARPAPAAMAEAEPDGWKTDIADGPIAERLDQKVWPVERPRAPVPPPERIVYVPGWRARTALPGPAPSRSASGVPARRGASAVQAP